MLLIRTQGRCKVSVRTVFFASLTISLLCFRIWTPTCQKTSYWVFYFILRWGIWIQAFINTQGNLEKGISSAELYLKPITWFRSKPCSSSSKWGSLEVTCHRGKHLKTDEHQHFFYLFGSSIPPGDPRADRGGLNLTNKHISLKPLWSWFLSGFNM